MSTWQIQTSQFLLPKSGIELSECEDAIAINEVSGRFAVADGATEAFDSQSWARLLVKDWVQLAPVAQTPEDFWVFVSGRAQVLHDSWSGLRLSWYSEEKARTGSFAAFVGVQLALEAPAPSWHAIALGDSCLVHCRDNAVLTSLPLAKSEQFNAAPLLVPSLSKLQGFALDKVVSGTGSLEKDDVLLLLSDAIACWYLRADEQTRSNFDVLLKKGRETELCELISDERSRGRMSDDDVAVIRIGLEG